MNLLTLFQERYDGVTARIAELDAERAVLVDRQAQLNEGILVLTPLRSGGGDPKLFGGGVVITPLPDDVQAILNAADVL